MKKQIFLFIICLSGISSFSKIKFEQGYIIDETGLKKDVLIQN